MVYTGAIVLPLVFFLLRITIFYGTQFLEHRSFGVEDIKLSLFVNGQNYLLLAVLYR